MWRAAGKLDPGACQRDPRTIRAAPDRSELAIIRPNFASGFITGKDRETSINPIRSVFFVFAEPTEDFRPKALFVRGLTRSNIERFEKCRKPGAECLMRQHKARLDQHRRKNVEVAFGQ